jgi:hypothetical protein
MLVDEDSFSPLDMFTLLTLQTSLSPHP